MFLKMDDSGQPRSYMGGWRVQSLSPSHGSASWGAAKRRGPTGGRAKGIPRYCFTRLSVPLAVTYWPLIRPFFRESTGSTLPADDTPMFMQGYNHVDFDIMDRHFTNYAGLKKYFMNYVLNI